MGKSKTSSTDPGRFKFLLFVTGMSAKSVTAMDNIRLFCDKHLRGNYELEIIDIAIQKHSAVEHQIIGVPTLIKVGPAPPRMILGDLSDSDKLLKILNVPVE